MALNTVTIHNTKRPQSFKTSEIFLDKVTVLIGFPHLGNESTPSFECELLNWVFLTSLACIILFMDYVQVIRISIRNNLDLRSLLTYIGR
jgi:hypothetical protein